MKFLDRLKNLFLYFGKYKTHSEAVIIACYYNPTNNPYRLIAFNKFYESIKHLNHRIVECVIGDSEPQLPNSEFITRVSTSTTLWHKEALLNGLIKTLPQEFKYVFWVDADVIFTNKNWMVDAVNELQPQKNRMVQLFEYCVHLEKDEFKPSFNYHSEKLGCSNPSLRHPRMWRSFGANFATTNYSDDLNYDKHGHVGFAWGARRSVLDVMPLYDKALIGGADHIMAHAAAGHINHNCIRKSFTDDIDAINEWSEQFRRVVGQRVGYVKGDLFHIWHGDVAKRQYLKRIQDFTSTAKEITEKDENGLYVTDNDGYVKEYFEHRENTGSTENYPVVDLSYTKLYPEVQKKKKPTKKQIEKKRVELRNQYPNHDDSFIESMLIAYMTDSAEIGTLMGGNMMGAVIGDLLNTDDQVTDQGFQDGFSGGDFSGGGAGGSWENDNSTENFS